jgi:hypothetical protein
MSEVLGARHRGGQDAKVRMLFASVLNDLVGYHEAYVFRFDVRVTVHLIDE